jgi:hypothetical protein
MATTTAGQLNYVEKWFDSYLVTYMSVDLGDPASAGTKCFAYIACYDKQQLVGLIKFYERQPPPVNSYRGSDPNYIVSINFHISRCNDMINILRYHKPLALSFDLMKLEGSVSSDFEAVGQQEKE